MRKQYRYYQNNFLNLIEVDGEHFVYRIRPDKLPHLQHFLETWLYKRESKYDVLGKYLPTGFPFDDVIIMGIEELSGNRRKEIVYKISEKLHSR